MAIRSLNRLRLLRDALIKLLKLWLTLRHGVEFHPGTKISLSAKFVPGSRGAISIGDRTAIAFKTLIIARDVDGSIRPIRIGEDCIVGGGSVILPGVTIGDGSIIGAGAVVFESVPPRCAVGGNPARILRHDIDTGPFGRLSSADENIRRLYR